jgi:hypothetical protein
MLAGLRISEVPIPTYYGDEICRVNGMKYAKDVLAACLEVRAQELSLFYDRKFDCRPAERSNAHYEPRLGFESTHTLTLERIPPGSRILDIGCAGGYLSQALGERCQHDRDDVCPLAQASRWTFSDPRPEQQAVRDLNQIDYAVMLDVIEHQHLPERRRRLRRLGPQPGREADREHRQRRVHRDPPDVVLRPVQLQVILDRTHMRLFTFRTFRRLFEESGFRVLEMRGVPAPFPLAIGSGLIARALLGLNRGLIRISRTLFSYQILAVVQPRPGLAHLLESAARASGQRAAQVDDEPAGSPGPNATRGAERPAPPAP